MKTVFSLTAGSARTYYGRCASGAAPALALMVPVDREGGVEPRRRFVEFVLGTLEDGPDFAPDQPPDALQDAVDLPQLLDRAVAERLAGQLLQPAQQRRRLQHAPHPERLAPVRSHLRVGLLP